MPTPSHIAYPSLVFIGSAELLSIPYSPKHVLLLIFFSVLPDFDFFYQLFLKKRGFDTSFRHHEWPSHWPIVYTPLLLLFLIVPNIYTFIVVLGVFSHFVLDSFFCGDGMMWGYPFTHKFYNFGASTTAGKHGIDWLKSYKKLPVFYLDIFASIVFVYILIFIIFQR